MMMRGIILLTLSVICLGTACAKTSEKPPKPMQQVRDLDVDSVFLDESCDLFAVQELTMPLAEHNYLLAKCGQKETVIRKATEFFPIVREITSADDALELVRLFTSQAIRPFLQDVYYSEVHKEVEPESEDEIVEPWFALSPEQYEEWKVQAPVVTQEEDGRYKIERFVVSYPRKEEEHGELIPPQLLKIREWVDAEGKYSMELQEVVAEDEGLQNILLFTK